MGDPTSKSDAPSEIKIGVWGGPRAVAPGECAYCDKWRADPMMPSHTPSARCESGNRPHCTCDTCF